MSDFKWFKSTVTGKVGRYPAHYGNRPTFIEVDPDTAECIDCAQKGTEQAGAGAGADADAGEDATTEQPKAKTRSEGRVK